MVPGNTGHTGPHLCCIGSLIDVPRFVRRAEIAVGQARVPVERILLLFARESGVESHDIEKSQDRWFRITGYTEVAVAIDGHKLIVDAGWTASGGNQHSSRHLITRSAVPPLAPRLQHAGPEPPTPVAQPGRASGQLTQA
jgi:hypothetical protein